MHTPTKCEPFPLPFTWMVIYALNVLWPLMTHTQKQIPTAVAVEIYPCNARHKDAFVDYFNQWGTSIRW